MTIPDRAADDVRRRLLALRADDLPDPRRPHPGLRLRLRHRRGRRGRPRRRSRCTARPTGSTRRRSRACSRWSATSSTFARPLFHAPAAAVGTVTSGGTESILLAVQTARDAHPDVDRPGHGGAHHDPRRVPEGRPLLRRRAGEPSPSTPDLPRRRRRRWRGRHRRVRRDRVVLVAAIAPSYAHGVLDPIPAIAAVAAARGLRFHVDACIGGWVLPWLERDGLAAHPWDFAVDGRHQRLGGPAQVRLHAQGRLAAAAPRPRSCVARSSSRAPTGPATRCSTRRCSRRSPAGRSRPRGPSSVPDRRRGLPDARATCVRRDAGRSSTGIGETTAPPGGRRSRHHARRRDDRRRLRRVHPQRRDARPRLVRAAADGVRRAAGDPAPDDLRGDVRLVPEFLEALRESVAEAVAAGPVVVDPPLRAAAGAGP